MWKIRPNKTWRKKRRQLSGYWGRTVQSKEPKHRRKVAANLVCLSSLGRKLVWLEGSELKEDCTRGLGRPYRLFRTSSFTLSKLHTPTCFMTPRNSEKKLIQSRYWSPWNHSTPTTSTVFLYVYNNVSIIQQCGPLMCKYVLDYTEIKKAHQYWNSKTFASLLPFVLRPAIEKSKQNSVCNFLYDVCTYMKYVFWYGK